MDQSHTTIKMTFIPKIKKYTYVKMVSKLVVLFITKFNNNFISKLIFAPFKIFVYCKIRFARRCETKQSLTAQIRRLSWRLAPKCKYYFVYSAN